VLPVAARRWVSTDSTSIPSSPHHRPNKAPPSINPHIEEGDPIELEEEVKAGAAAEDPSHQNNNPNESKKFFCHFHGRDSDHTTNYCPEKKNLRENGGRKECPKTGQPYHLGTTTFIPILLPKPKLQLPATPVPLVEPPSIHKLSTFASC
jgi:hypothetical protein